MIGEEETLADHLGPGVGPDHPEQIVDAMTEEEIMIEVETPTGTADMVIVRLQARNRQNRLG